MKPIYFPFTTLSGPVLGALLTCFNRVAVYQPSRNHIPESIRNWETEGRLQVRLPDEDENDPLPHLLKAYHAWAELHKGEQPDFEKFRPPLAPYTDTSATSRIRSDIRKAAEGTETAPSDEEKERSMLIRARLFLTVAQKHDQLQQTLREDLNRIGNMERDLFRDLLKDQEEPFPVDPPNRSAEAFEHNSYMSAARMAAWARLHVHHREKAATGEAPDLLITSDRTALDQLLETADSADMICRVSGIPFGSVADPSGNVFFNEQRCEKLGKLAAESDRSGAWDTFLSDTGSEGADTGRLTIYRIKGDAVFSLLSKSEYYTKPSGMHKESADNSFTLAGSIIKKDC